MLVKESSDCGFYHVKTVPLSHFFVTVTLNSSLPHNKNRIINPSAASQRMLMTAPKMFVVSHGGCVQARSD